MPDDVILTHLTGVYIIHHKQNSSWVLDGCDPNDVVMKLDAGLDCQRWLISGPTADTFALTADNLKPNNAASRESIVDML
jgi:hypothetical protein